MLGSSIAGLPVKRPPKDAPAIIHILARGHIDIKAAKMALYGFLISAPLGHVLVGALQKAFAGKTGTTARIAQILASNLLVAPIQTAGELCKLRLKPEGSKLSLSLWSSIPGFHGSDQWCQVIGRSRPNCQGWVPSGHPGEKAWTTCHVTCCSQILVR